MHENDAGVAGQITGASTEQVVQILMLPDAAAAAIVAGFERGLLEIRFPKLFSGLLRLISRLPYSLRFKVLHKVTGL